MPSKMSSVSRADNALATKSTLCCGSLWVSRLHKIRLKLRNCVISVETTEWLTKRRVPVGVIRWMLISTRTISCR